MNGYMSFVITHEPPGLETIEEYRYADIEVAQVEVLQGGNFTLSLYKGFENAELLQEIPRPQSGEVIPMNQTIDCDLTYRLKCEDERPLKVNVIYKLVPRIPPAIMPL